MHEVGHYIGGKLSGYQLVFLQIGPGNLIGSRAGKLSFAIRKTKGAQCVMLPPDKNPIRYRAYNLGGIVCNAVIMIGAFGLLFLKSHYATLILIELFYAGALKVVGNLFPRFHNGTPNDGYILKLLKGKPSVQRDYAKYLALYAAMFWEESVCVEDCFYEREPVENEEELLYYNATQELLSDLSSEKEIKKEVSNGY